MGRVTIHHNPAIPWHRERVGQFESGLRRLHIDVTRTESGVRINNDPAILFGTSAFKAVERSPDWLLVDRACWGDPDFVRLGWNGRGTTADYRIPDEKEPRWIPELEQIEPDGKRIVFGDYGVHPLIPRTFRATHYKPHPMDGSNPTNLPTVDSWDGCEAAYCRSSTVAVELMLRGVDVVCNEQNMAQMSLEDISWTQWSWEEIEQGEPIRHLFEWLA